MTVAVTPEQPRADQTQRQPERHVGQLRSDFELRFQRLRRQHRMHCRLWRTNHMGHYKDGHAHHFDGAKDLFKYLQELPKYAPGHRAEDMKHIAVTDFYNLQKIDARQALYVTGSDVLGPMGIDFVLVERELAKRFVAEHGAKHVYAVEAITS